MYSSKSSHLLSEINRYRYITHPDGILVISHIFDKLRHPEMNDGNNMYGCIKTHNSKTFPALMVHELNDIINLKEYTNSEIVLIDEAQFYPDLYTFIKYQLQNTNKMFIVAGLCGDTNQELFGEIYKLIPLSDEILKLHAFCSYCKNGTLASFTKRLVDHKSQILIGAEESYIPVCRKHIQ